MTPDQLQKPSWIDDDHWTYRKTDMLFDHFLEQMNHRPLTKLEREWILTLLPVSCHSDIP